MKKLILIILLLMLLPVGVSAQDTPALLLYVKGDQDGWQTVHVLDVLTGEERLITDSVDDAGWSPDGRVWVVDTVEETRRLRFFDVNSGAETTFPESLYNDPCEPSVRWSPDGEQFVYYTWDNDHRVRHTLNLADGSGYQIPTLPYDAPQWSPDGRYVVDVQNGPYRLLTAVDGREVLTNLDYASFSPDSRYLIYKDTDRASWLYELDTGAASLLDTVPSREWDWSSDGRYLFFNDYYAYEANHTYYDTQTGSLHQLEFEAPVKIVSWAADEHSILLYANPVDYSGEMRPTTLLSYDLATGESFPLLTGVVWIGSISRSDSWLVIPYSLTPPENHYSPTSHLLLNGEQRLEFELEVGIGRRSGSSVEVLDNRRGFLIWSPDGLYIFDTQTTRIEPVYPGIISLPYPSSGSDYLAFMASNTDRHDWNITIWNNQTKTISRPLEEDSGVWLIGWQGTNRRNSLLNCGEG
jgi:hypothetical protein